MFESGVQKYLTVQAVIETGFPVDDRGVVYAACKYCRYFSHSIDMCQISKEVVFLPDKFVGHRCPFNAEEENDV